jgi:hypothetical protein
MDDIYETLADIRKENNGKQVSAVRAKALHLSLDKEGEIKSQERIFHSTERISRSILQQK